LRIEDAFLGRQEVQVMMRTLGILCLFGAPLVGLGCTGGIGDASGTPPGMVGTPGQTGAPGGSSTPGGSDTPITSGPAAQPGAGALNDDTSVPATAPVRRLTKLEYDNTLRDLLGLPASIKTEITADTDSANAGFVRGGAITDGDDARKLLAGSTQISDAVVSRLGTLLPCSPLPTAAAEQDACVVKFIDQFGRRAYRRPLSAAEAEQAHKLYITERGPDVGATFEEAVTDLVSAFIQAPQFLYHWELGPNAPVRDGNLVRYNSYEVASRLSYMFWATMPDDKLFAAAQVDALKTPEQIAIQARRLLNDDRAKQGLADFHTQWMEIGSLTDIPKDDGLNFTPAVGQAMLNETRDFVASIFQGGKATGTLESLLTSTDTVIDPSLAKLYGVTASGNGPQPVALKASERSGILTHLAFLTSRADPGDSHPVKRGDTLLRRLLCIELVVPPTLMIPPVADAVPGGATTRQRFEMHKQPQCAGCHAMLDPAGFAFEAYDAVGAFRKTDQGKPVDTAGTLTLPTGEVLNFKDAIDLTAQLAKMDQVRDCMSLQWTRYMLGRREVDGEAPSITVARDLWKKSNYDFRELLVGLTRTRSFTHRSLSPGEVSQ
jgi:hypothetical protein